jgi:hypothetical protein
MKQKFIKIICSTLIVGAFLILAFGSDESNKDADSKGNSSKNNEKKYQSSADLIGRSFNMEDGFHVVEFTSSSSYHIHQKPYNCGGDGTWSMQGEKIILGSNDSNCESTRDIAGAYEISAFK